MSPSAKQQTPRAIALGGICLLGLGVSGCSRENGLDLAKHDARTDSAITERANESILRSKQELAGTKGHAKGSTAAGLAETESETADKPSLASRWKAPFKGAGNLLKRKPADEVDDPFLAQSKQSGEKEAAKVKDSIATLQQEKALEAKAASAGDKKLAMADSQSRSPAATGASKSAPPMSKESKAALDDFLKSQEPIGVEGRALAAGYEKEIVTQKPGATPKPKKSATETFTDQAVASGKPSDILLEHRTLGNRSVASAGTARPFPTDYEPAETKAQPAGRPTSKLRQHAQTADDAKLAAADRQKPLNPLAEEPAKPSKTKLSTGREIAGLLKKAKSAGDRGQIEEALSLAVAANDLAEQCSYEFAAGEQTPTIMMDWLSDKQAEAEQLSRGKTERRQMLAARRPEKNVDALPAAFSTPTAERNFFTDGDEAVADNTANSGDRKFGGEPSFNEWASTVGKQAPGKQRSPEWPSLSTSELAASDELWQPSRSSTQQSPAMDRRPAADHASAGGRETRLASAETDAPGFVATADVRGAIETAAVTHDPIVQLGQPTDLAPGVRNHLAARSDSASGTTRGPRLSAPPPLSIENEGGATAKSTSRSKGLSRTLFYWLLFGLAAAVMLGFRRWAYPAIEGPIVQFGRSPVAGKPPEPK